MSDKFTTASARASYGIGRQIGEQLTTEPFEGMQTEAIIAGISDVIDGKESQVSETDMQAAIADLNQRIQRQQEQESSAAAASGEQFLKENAERDEVTVTDSGLQYEVLEDGTGDKPAATSQVRVHYHGSLPDGTVFDSSVERGEPMEFPVNGVIPGWTEALQLMPAGSKWKLVIPHQLAYGANGAGDVIGPYATLIFEVELLQVL